jgi:hypothetical protein
VSQFEDSSLRDLRVLCVSAVNLDANALTARDAENAESTQRVELRHYPGISSEDLKALAKQVRHLDEENSTIAP